LSFYLYVLCGLCGGILGGMGMGGGTALIPLLTVVLGVEQTVAQGVNLLSFLPMSALALSVHAKNGLLKREGLLPLIVPAVLCSAAASLLATVLPPVLLKKGFGAFLTVLSFYQFSSAVKLMKDKRLKKTA